MAQKSSEKNFEREVFWGMGGGGAFVFCSQRLFFFFKTFLAVTKLF